MKNRLTSLLVIIMVAIFGWAGKRARCPNGPQQGSPGLNMKFIEDLVINPPAQIVNILSLPRALNQIQEEISMF